MRNQWITYYVEVSKRDTHTHTRVKSVTSLCLVGFYSLSTETTQNNGMQQKTDLPQGVLKSALFKELYIIIAA